MKNEDNKDLLKIYCGCCGRIFFCAAIAIGVICIVQWSAKKQQLFSSIAWRNENTGKQKTGKPIMMVS